MKNICVTRLKLLNKHESDPQITQIAQIRICVI
jgi:hypothetical protein